MIQSSNTCQIVFNDPYLALAWLRALVGNITPDDYMAIFKALNPMNADAATHAQHLVDICFGAAS